MTTHHLRNMLETDLTLADTLSHSARQLTSHVSQFYLRHHLRNELGLPLPNLSTTTTHQALQTDKQVKPPKNLNRQLRQEKLVGKQISQREIWRSKGEGANRFSMFHLGIIKTSDSGK